MVIVFLAQAVIPEILSSLKRGAEHSQVGRKYNPKQ
jgi:hypothetical protein